MAALSEQLLEGACQAGVIHFITIACTAHGGAHGTDVFDDVVDRQTQMMADLASRPLRGGPWQSVSRIRSHVTDIQSADGRRGGIHLRGERAQDFRID